MRNAFTHHLRGTLPPAEHIQTDPLTVLRSIDRAEIVKAFCIFSALAFVAGAVLAMGAK